MSQTESGSTDGGVRDTTFHGPAAILAGSFGTQNVQFVYQWKPAYRIEDFPTAPRPLRSRMLAEQPSRLLRAVHQVVPFTGRDADVEALASWRDDPAEKLAVRLVHGPGGQGKTRLAAHFAGLSHEAGWSVWQAIVNETGADSLATSTPPEAGTGILLVVDYAERWPTPDLHRLLQEPLLHRSGVPVRILLLSRPAGIWWESLDTWIGDRLDASTEPHPLLPLADAPQARAALFHRACDSFADNLGLPPDRASRIGPPLDLDTNQDYAQILTVHIAALAAVDAHMHHDAAPTNPARASAYLLKRERAHWTALHQRPSQPLSATPEAMGRAVLTATLTRPLARPHGQDALSRIGLVDSTAAANSILDDHRYCYPAASTDPARSITVLEPLYPDRLGEDFLGLTTPANPDTPHPVPGAVTDDWAHQAAHRLLATTDPATPAPWAREALTMLIETARRWPHIAAGQLYPLLKQHPALALQAGGTALATLAELKTLDLTVLEAIEPHLPTGRHTDLDVGIAAITLRLARHRLATTSDPATHARTHENLAIRQTYAGLRNEALATGEAALRAWRDLTRTNPAYERNLAGSLTNLGIWLSEAGRWQEALPPTEEAVALYRRLAADNPAAHEPNLAGSLTNLGALLSALGRWQEALPPTEEAVGHYRRLAADNPAAYEPNLATSLTNHGALLSALGRWQEALPPTEEAVEIRRRLATGNPAAYEPNLATSLTNHGALLSELGRRKEALPPAKEAVALYRRLATGNPAAYEPDLASSLTNLGALLAQLGRRQEALPPTEKAVEIRRRLATGNPAAYEPNLATSLTNHGALLSELGRRKEALPPAKEAVALYRRLATGNPAAYEPDLASSLTNLGALLAQLGRREEALATELEAVEIRRRLATGNSAAYESDLAASLTNLGIRLSELGRGQDALTNTEEAVEMHRRLVTGNPAAHERDLAGSVINLGNQLSEVGQPQKALTSTEEAVALYRRLAAGNPAAHEPDLAASLVNLGIRLLQVGQPQEALTSTEEAVGLYRRLAAGNPAAYEPDLAASLCVWAGVRYEARQDLSEALRATGEAVEIYRRLVTAVPARFLSPLREVLGLQANLLFRLGRARDARDILKWLTVSNMLPARRNK